MTVIARAALLLSALPGSAVVFIRYTLRIGDALKEMQGPHVS